jgi:hypothetical protein
MIELLKDGQSYHSAGIKVTMTPHLRPHMPRRSSCFPGTVPDSDLREAKEFDRRAKRITAGPAEKTAGDAVAEGQRRPLPTFSGLPRAHLALLHVPTSRL